MFSMSDYGGFRIFNEAYISELYERYRNEPKSVDPESRAVFSQWAPVEPSDADAAGEDSSQAPCDSIVRAVTYAESVRKFGYLDARIDPLSQKQPGDPSLLPRTHGIDEEELHRLPANIVFGTIAEGKANAWEAIQELVENPKDMLLEA